MKKSELIQLYVLLNKFRDEHIDITNTQLQTYFDAVDDAIDYELSTEDKLSQ